MDMAIQRRRPVKVLSREKLERDILFTFDEKTRRLAVCAPTKVLYLSLTSESSFSAFFRNQLHLHSFVFDEAFKTLQRQGSGIDLFPWYSQAGETSITHITHIAFVCGTEEVVFIDSNARARIFSFVSKKFRSVSTLSVWPYPSHRLVDQLLYSFRRLPALYSRPQTVLASSHFTPTISSRLSLLTIGRPLAPLRELPLIFLISHFKVLS